MKTTIRNIALIVGAVIIVMAAVIGGRAAIQSVNGLAVAQTSTQWNNLKDSAAGDNLTSGVGAFNLYMFDGTNFDRLRGDTTNGIDVDVTRLPTNVGGATTPSDDFANPTTAVNDFSLIAGFDGTTWDRVRTGSNAADDLATTALGNVQGLSFLYGFDGTTWDRLQTSSTTGHLETTVCDDGTADLCADIISQSDNVTTSIDGLVVQAIEIEFDGTTNDRIRHSFTQSTTGITTNAAGTTVTMTTTPMNKYTMIINRTAGATDVVEIDLECSIDNVAVVQIATITSLVGEPVLASVGNTPCNLMRYNVVTVGAGNTLAIDLLATR